MTDKTAENFDYAVQKTLRNEGGYVHDPDDPGGETRYGISSRHHPEVNIKTLTQDQARNIYFQDYWRATGIWGINNRDIAAKVFDLAVNIGPGPAVRLLQKAVNATSFKEIKVDGILGKMTRTAVNDWAHERFLLATLKLEAVAYYVNLGKPKYLAGWVRRALS